MVQYTKVAKRQAHHLCIFGDTKSGKSTFIANAAKVGFKLLWFSMDSGDTVIDKLQEKEQELINLIKIRDTKEQPIAIHTITKVMDGGLRRICVEHGILECTGCKTAKAPFDEVDVNKLGLDTIVVIDHMSQVSDSAIAAISKKEAKGDPDGYKLDFGDWALQGAMMARILSNVQQAKFHVACLFHSAEVEMEDGQKKLVPQVGTLNFSRNAGKYFDTIIYTGVRMQKHVAGSHTTFMHNVVSGSRTDVVLKGNAVDDIIALFGKPVAAPKEETVAVIKTETVTTTEEATSLLPATSENIAKANEDGKSDPLPAATPAVVTAEATKGNALAALAALKLRK